MVWHAACVCAYCTDTLHVHSPYPLKARCAWYTIEQVGAAILLGSGAMPQKSRVFISKAKGAAR